MHTTSGADLVSGFMEDKDGNRIYKWKVLLDTVDSRTFFFSAWMWQPKREALESKLIELSPFFDQV